jgi:hypothetical protein
MADAEKRAGLPAGTMLAVMHQEAGGQFDRFLTKPDDYHYQADANGKRKSSAFGLFGILDSTARDPGYGVAPLKDKSIGEQVRFAADYLGARAKQAGGLEAGLAGYGEGSPYAKQVMARIGQPAQVTLAADPSPAGMTPVAPAPTVVAQAAPAAAPAPVMAPAPVDQTQAPDPWQAFLAQSASRPVTPEDLQYGQAVPATAPAAPLAVPNFMAALNQVASPRPLQLGAFHSLKRWG